MYKYVRMKLYQYRFEVSVSVDEIHWSMVYKNKEIEPCEIIIEAYKKVGLIDKTTY